MKKTECSSKKKTVTTEWKRRQRNISAYLVKKPEVLEVANEITCRKRRMSESLESSITQYKAAKSNGSDDDVCIVDCIQRGINILQPEATLAPVILVNNDTNTIVSDHTNTFTSVEKSSITECDGKENVNVNISENMLSNLNKTQTKVQNSKSTNSTIILSEKSFVDECAPSLEKKSKDLDDSLLIEIIEHVFEPDIRVSDNSSSVEVIEKDVESDIQLLDHKVDNVNDVVDEDWFIEDDVNFNSLQRCKLIDLKYEQDALLLTVETSAFYIPVVIRCLGFWKHIKVEKNSIIAVEARKDKNCWVVDNDTGFIVTYPDILISGTTIVGGIFCQRRSVLNEKFKKVESLPYYESNQILMLVGNLVHELLQRALKANITKYADVKNLLDDMLHSKEVAYMLYTAGVTSEFCRKEMLMFVPKVYAFILHYLREERQEEITSMKNNFKGSIVNVVDIEETIWLPKLGIKGKIDVTVEVKRNSVRRRMPLEIKTGRPSFSFEHKGQIILYIMMMALTGKDTDTGLLLYLRENSMQEINSDHRERRDLMLLRNALAYYLAPKPFETSSESPSDWQWTGFHLSEPINHPSACSKCPYNALCCAYLSKDNCNKISDEHPLNQLKKTILEDVSSSHIDYILNWILLLEIEDQAQTADNPSSNLWTLSPDERELRKTCISNLKVLEVKEYNGKYRHTFVRKNSKGKVREKNIPYMEFSENEYVLISTDERVNVSSGFIVHLGATSIMVITDRDITRYINNGSIHIDKYSSSSLHCSNLANVGGLLGNTAICVKLRNIVIDKKPATFEPGVSQSIVLKGSEILGSLNKSQRTAVLKVLTADDYILIKGMPGTGKTQTSVALIELLHKTGRSVLITSHTNSAVDNILLKLLRKGINFLRLGSSVHESLKAYSDKRVTATCKTPEELEAAYSKNIVGVTCYGAYHPLLSKRTFDVCIVDESAQIFQPTILRPLYSAHKFVLIGDPDQLPPIVKSQQARRLGADESLFSRLDSENNTVVLTAQYRMNRHIMNLANKLTYADKLTAGNLQIENATYGVNCTEANILKETKQWIRKALSPQLSDSVILINTGCTNTIKVDYKFRNKYPESDQTYSNILEGAILLKLIQTLLEIHVKAENIGIIAPYRAHVNLLKSIIQNSIEINTVDQYQGRDKEIILYSCAKSLINNNNVKQDFEVLGDHRRLTVAITRAKCKLIIIGDKCTLLRYSAFKKLFDLIGDNNTIDLNDNRDDFSWKEILSVL